MLDAPVEWIHGDSIWPRRFLVIRWGIWGGLIGGALLLWIHEVLVAEGVVPGPPWVPFGSILILVPWLAFALGLTALAVFPGRLPVAGAIGISPPGLAIPSLFRRRVFSWNRIRWIDATHIYVRLDLGSQRVELTPYQATRIRHFFGEDPALR